MHNQSITNYHLVGESLFHPDRTKMFTESVQFLIDALPDGVSEAIAITGSTRMDVGSLLRVVEDCWYARREHQRRYYSFVQVDYNGKHQLVVQLLGQLAFYVRNYQTITYMGGIQDALSERRTQFNYSPPVIQATVPTLVALREQVRQNQMKEQRIHTRSRQKKARQKVKQREQMAKEQEALQDDVIQTLSALQLTPDELLGSLYDRVIVYLARLRGTEKESAVNTASTGHIFDFVLFYLFSITDSFAQTSSYRDVSYAEIVTLVQSGAFKTTYPAVLLALRYLTKYAAEPKVRFEMMRDSDMGENLYTRVEMIRLHRMDRSTVSEEEITRFITSLCLVHSGPEAQLANQVIEITVARRGDNVRADAPSLMAYSIYKKYLLLPVDQRSTVRRDIQSLFNNRDCLRFLRLGGTTSPGLTRLLYFYEELKPYVERYILALMCMLLERLLD
jgi:hypothetical protein